MGPRIFTVREANELIPRLEEAMRDYDAIRERLRRVKSKMDVLEMIWGEELQSPANPDHREHQHYLKEVDAAKQDFDAVTRRLSDMEVVPKSLDQGLVDFYGVIDRRLVFLCWKRGEKAVDYYHGLEDGFAGRRPIGAERKLE